MRGPMRQRTILLFAIALLGAAPAPAAPDGALKSALTRDVTQYLAARSQIEHISAVSVSISLHGVPQTIDVTAGTTQYGGAGKPIRPDSLWQIGSNTKAFTAAAILQLEAEGKLTIDQTLGSWLPQYPAWKNVTIRRLLNMTSGIPTYDLTSAMLSSYARNRMRNFTAAELVHYAYPATPGAPKATTGYDYSNTNYILAQMIVERASGHGYSSELDRRFLRGGLTLGHTYYATDRYPKSVRDRLIAWYFVDRDADVAPLAPLLGRDVSQAGVSWLQGAGGIVGTPQDLTRWARALYAGSTLAPKQRAEMMALVSQTTGKPIAKTSLRDPRGFGLGIAQITTLETGTIWFYVGETMGFRVIHEYFPRQDVALAIGLNSHPDSGQDELGKLTSAVYKTLHAAGKL
jgi:D-alanyl-D-alanine carboxypeptidase